MGDSKFVNLLVAAFVAGILTPVVWITSLESVLHIGVDLASILAKDELFKVLKYLLVVFVDDVFWVTVKELLLVSPERLWGKGRLMPEAAANRPDKDTSEEN